MAHVIHVVRGEGGVDSSYRLPVTHRNLKGRRHVSVCGFHVGDALVQALEYTFSNGKDVGSVAGPFEVAIVHQIFLSPAYGVYFELLEIAELQQYLAHVESERIPFYWIFFATAGPNADRDGRKQ